MPRWATTILIAGVDFSGCRGLIQGGSEFNSLKKGSLDWAADGTPFIQVIDTGQGGTMSIGSPFAIQMGTVAATDVLEAIANINLALESLLAFAVHLVDALNDINVMAYPDFTQKPWFTHGPESEGMIDDVVIHFVSFADNS